MSETSATIIADSLGLLHIPRALCEQLGVAPGDFAHVTLRQDKKTLIIRKLPKEKSPQEVSLNALQTVNVARAVLKDNGYYGTFAGKLAKNVRLKLKLTAFTTGEGKRRRYHYSEPDVRAMCEQLLRLNPDDYRLDREMKN